MPDIVSDGLRIHYRVEGQGPPLLLIHGWAASSRTQWDAFGWTDFLKPHFRLIMPDLRGHGGSAKPMRRSAYSIGAMARDVVAVLDAESVDSLPVLGYSTGAEVATGLLLEYPCRISAAVLGGVGTRFHFGWGRTFEPDDGQPRPAFDWFPLRNAPSFLWWAVNNFVALGICFLALFDGRPPVPAERLHEIAVPVLTVVGNRGGFCPSNRDLAGRVPGAKRVVISGRNHATTIGDRRFKQAALAFLQTVSSARGE